MNAAFQRYRAACDLIDQVAAAAPDETWDLPSPCTAWNARQLAGHLVDGYRQVHALLSGEAPITPTGDSSALSRLAGRDPADALRAAAGQVLAALPGLEPVAVIATPRGPLPAEQLLGMALIEPVVHGWDLAVATGQPGTLDPELTAALLPAVEQLGGQLADTGMYAHALPVADDATDAQRLLAALGRPQG